MGKETGRWIEPDYRSLGGAGPLAIWYGSPKRDGEWWVVGLV